MSGFDAWPTCRLLEGPHFNRQVFAWQAIGKKQALRIEAPVFRYDIFFRECLVISP